MDTIKVGNFQYENENFNTFQFETLEALEITSAAEGHFEIPGTES